MQPITSIQTFVSQSGSSDEHPLPEQPLLVGRQSPISKAALLTGLGKLRHTPRPPEDAPATSTARRRQLSEMMIRHRATPPSQGRFRLSPHQLGSAARVDSQLYHHRTATEAPVFFSEFATEKPSLSMVDALSEGKRDYYVVRHLGKRGRDLYTDEPVEGNDSKIGQLKTSPLLSTQRSGVRAIRGFAATATIDQGPAENILVGCTGTWWRCSEAGAGLCTWCGRRVTHMSKTAHSISSRSASRPNLPIR